MVVGNFQASLPNESSASVLCPGDIIVINCSIVGGGITAWNGSSFQCNDHNTNIIALRHTQFKQSQKPRGTCNNGDIVARAIGVVNDSYISQLNVTVTPALNNTTVKCWHDYNLTETIVKTVDIVLASHKISLDPHLSQVGKGKLTFSWDRKTEHCNSSSYQYFIESIGCGDCPQKTNDNYVTCKNVSITHKQCSFTVEVNTSDINGMWEDGSLSKTINVTLQGKT